MSDTSKAVREALLSLTINQLDHYPSGAMVFEGEVRGATEDEDDVLAGRWKATVLPRYDDGDSADDIADEVSQEAYDAMLAWEHAEVDVVDVGDYLLLVDVVDLEESFRGMGLGAVVLRLVIRTVGYGAGVVVLKPAPVTRFGAPDLSPAEWTAARDKIAAYWQRACPGFAPLGDDDHLWLDRGRRHDWLEGAL